MRLQAAWISAPAKGIAVREIEAVRNFVAALRGNLEAGEE
jgi:hypothetical protein